MTHALSLKAGGFFGALASIALLGCQQSYWVASSDLAQARQLQPAHAPEAIAIRGSPRAGGGGEVYLRISTVKLPESSVVPLEPQVKLHVPNKRGKTIGGAILTGLGGALVVGAVGMIGYAGSINRRDSLGAGIVGGLAGIPLGVGIPLVISGGVLLGRGAGPSDIVLPEQREIIYVPALSPAP